jgi:hypothetical protein
MAPACWCFHECCQRKLKGGVDIARGKEEQQEEIDNDLAGMCRAHLSNVCAWLAFRSLWWFLVHKPDFECYNKT